MFGTLKNESLLIKSLASNNCFSYEDFFQNGVDITLASTITMFLNFAYICFRQIAESGSQTRLPDAAVLPTMLYGWYVFNINLKLDFNPNYTKTV